MKTKGTLAVVSVLLVMGGVLWWYNRPAPKEIQIGAILGLTGTNSAYGKGDAERFRLCD